MFYNDKHLSCVYYRQITGEILQRRLCLIIQCIQKGFFCHFVM